VITVRTLFVFLLAFVTVGLGYIITIGALHR
jgi:hypothetical protein